MRYAVCGMRMRYMVHVCGMWYRHVVCGNIFYSYHVCSMWCGVRCLILGVRCVEFGRLHLEWDSRYLVLPGICGRLVGGVRYITGYAVRCNRYL